MRVYVTEFEPQLEIKYKNQRGKVKTSPLLDFQLAQIKAIVPHADIHLINNDENNTLTQVELINKAFKQQEAFVEKSKKKYEWCLYISAGFSPLQLYGVTSLLYDLERWPQTLADYNIVMISAYTRDSIDHRVANANDTCFQDQVKFTQYCGGLSPVFLLHDSCLGYDWLDNKMELTTALAHFQLSQVELGGFSVRTSDFIVAPPNKALNLNNPLDVNKLLEWHGKHGLYLNRKQRLDLTAFYHQHPMPYADNEGGTIFRLLRSEPCKLSNVFKKRYKRSKPAPIVVKPLAGLEKK
jgi:hypothetical protein